MNSIALTSSKALACCVALLSALLPLHAAEHAVVFEAHPVVQVFQQPGETWEGFVSNAARAMRDYTDKTGFEAGGWLCVHSGTGLGAMSIISNHSQISVSAGIKGCPLQGYELTSEFMHSHPVKDRIVLTENDLHGYPLGKVARLLKGMRAGSSVPVGASGGRFSQADIAVGPGYLVHGDNLLYQKNGRQTFGRNLQATDDTRAGQGPDTAQGSNRLLTAQGLNAAAPP